MLVDEKSFQERVQRIGALVNQLDAIADPASRAAAKDLFQSLMDLHGAGLERIFEVIFQSGEPGTKLIDELGQDPLVGSLLVLYGLHSEDMQTRIERKLHAIRSKLHKMGAEAELTGVSDGEVRVRIAVESHACGSTKATVRATVEEALYEAAPDLTTLLIDGLEQPAASGFVSVDKLAGPALPAVSPTIAVVSEGMD